ncbi:MAG: hypothetical protein RR630_11430, partial [Coprobacillus sp.]
MYKTVLITGGGSGLGKQICIDLLNGGYFVHVIDILPQIIFHNNLIYQQKNLTKYHPKELNYDIFISNVTYKPIKQKLKNIKNKMINEAIDLNVRLPLLMIKNNNFKKVIFINSIV